MWERTAENICTYKFGMDDFISSFVISVLPSSLDRQARLISFREEEKCVNRARGVLVYVGAIVACRNHIKENRTSVRFSTLNFQFIGSVQLRIYAPTNLVWMILYHHL